MSSVSQARLAQERKQWRKDKPFGFHARPETNADGSTNLYKWKCYIPGEKDTEWEGGFYPVTMEFAEEYPSKPPKDQEWRPSITVKQILVGIQKLLKEPNPDSPAQADAYMCFIQRRADYDRQVKQQARKFPPPT